MELGTGIFLSAIFLGIVALFIATKDIWNWKKIFLWPIGAIVVLAIVGGTITYLYGQYQDRPRKLTEFWGVSLNDTLGDVIFKKGEPTLRFTDNKDPQNVFWFYGDDMKELPKSNNELRELTNGYFVQFKNNRIRSISFEGKGFEGISLPGIGNFESLQQIENKLGPPSHVSRLEGELRRAFSFEKFNIVVMFAGGNMVSRGIYDPTHGPIKFSAESKK